MEMRSPPDSNDQKDIHSLSLHHQVLGTQPQRRRSDLLHMVQMAHSDQEPCRKTLQKRECFEDVSPFCYSYVVHFKEVFHCFQGNLYPEHVEYYQFPCITQIQNYYHSLTLSLPLSKLLPFIFQNS